MAPPRSLVRFKARVLDGAKPAAYPGFVAPCLAIARRKAPLGAQWVHELALGGERVQAHLVRGRVRLYGRTGEELTAGLAAVAAALTGLPANHAVLDGEVVGAADAGRIYCAYDLLHLDGFDISAVALVERKRVLCELLAEAKLPGIVYAEHWEDAVAAIAAARATKRAGTVSKLRDSPYRSGPCTDWIAARVHPAKCAQAARGARP